MTQPFHLLPRSIVVCQCLLLVCAVSVFSVSSIAEEVDFEKVRPILTKYCSGCHNQNDASGDFALTTFDEMMVGGETGNALTPQSSSSSRMVGMMRGSIHPTMPPEGESKPSDDEIQLIADWIDAGAIGPTGEKNLPSTMDVPEIASDVSFRPVTALALSADEEKLAVGRFGQVEILDAQSDATVMTFDKLPGKITALKFLNNDKTIIAATGTAGLYGEAVLLDVESGDVVQRLGGKQGHRDMVYSIAVSDDEKSIVTAGYDRRAILWQLESPDPIRTFEGHNDAIFDCGFAKEDSLLVTASADATVKVWRTADAQRLDTRGEPLKEQYCVAVSPDDRWLFAAGEDSRIRKWELQVSDEAQINPLQIARFAHDSGISFLRLHLAGDHIVSFGSEGLVKIWDTKTLNLQHAFDKIPGTVLAVAVGSRQIIIGTADGKTHRLDWPVEELKSVSLADASSNDAPISSAENDVSIIKTEPQEVVEAEPNNGADQAQTFSVPFMVKGCINAPAENPSVADEDFYRFTASKGQVLKIEVDSKSDADSAADIAFDSHIAVLDAEGEPVPQVLLRAIRDTYVTFRGRDSDESDNFRLHQWEEMHLNQYLYLNGEVMLLYHYPRGPDSGFNLFPNFGKRHAFFGTTAITHALGEPGYIVEAHPPGTKFPSVGLPIIELNYENDDDSQRRLGTDSRLVFTAPEDGEYIVRIRDSRAFEADNFKYRLLVGKLVPGFQLLPFSQDEISVAPNGYKKIEVKIARDDNFEGPVVIELNDLPEGFSTPGKITIEEGNLRGFMTVHRGPDAAEIPEDKPVHITVTAAAVIGQQKMTRTQKLGRLKLGEAAKLTIELAPEGKLETIEGLGELPVIEITAGGTAKSLIKVTRRGHDGPVTLGKEDAALNLPFGVYVGNTGLNGVLIPKGETEREFVLEAEPWVKPCERLIFAEAEEAGRPSSNSALLRVLPRH